MQTGIAVSRSRSLRRIVDCRRILHRHRESQAADRGIGADRLEAVHRIRRNLDKVALPDFSVLTLDGHDAAAGKHIIELESGMAVRVYLAAPHHLELAHQLKMAAERLLAHLARLEQPPDGDRALMLRRRRHLFDRSDVHYSSF